MLDRHSPQSGELGHFPRLPLDVLANIIGELDPQHPRDAYTLRSLSLSCHSALHFSQMALFKSVDVVLSSRGSFSQRVLRLKSAVSSPRIAQYVRHFKIVLDVREQDCGPEISTALGELGSLLPNLKDIHSFTLRCAFLKSLVRQKKCLDWCSLDPAFRGAVEGVIASPALVHLQIARVEKFPLNVFLDHASWIDLVVEEPYVIDIRIVSPLMPGAAESKDTDVSGVHRTIAHVRSYSVAEGSRGSWPFDETYCVRPDAVLITGFDYPFNLSNLRRASVYWWHRGAARDTLHVVPFQLSLRSFACTGTAQPYDILFQGLILWRDSL
ncbi:hypothetical protein CVT26_003794 [Gymnopilus dilepis]|uniref:F-box domain-containing protein n=1 Tax=Gymnopilus dilepis TaxID=231916 RepID=A0A409W1M2_9AGAR|nr:hypothetical protein CVT26_003794 [Gymnopilus dilepis]